MTTKQLYAVTGAVKYGGPRRRVRRSWGRTLVGLLMLLALSALAGWLLHCVRHALLVRGGVTAVPGLAVALTTPEMVLVADGVLLVIVLMVAAKWIKRWDDERLLQWSVVEQPTEPEAGRIARTTSEVPMPERWKGLDCADTLERARFVALWAEPEAGRIARATLEVPETWTKEYQASLLNCCREWLVEVRKMLPVAGGTLSLEEHADALTMAGRRPEAIERLLVSLVRQMANRHDVAQELRTAAESQNEGGHKL